MAGGYGAMVSGRGWWVWCRGECVFGRVVGMMYMYLCADVHGGGRHVCTNLFLLVQCTVSSSSISSLTAYLCRETQHPLTWPWVCSLGTCLP